MLSLCLCPSAAPPGVLMVWRLRMQTALLPQWWVLRSARTNSPWRLLMRGSCRVATLSRSSSEKVRISGWSTKWWCSIWIYYKGSFLWHLWHNFVIPRISCLSHMCVPAPLLFLFPCRTGPASCSPCCAKCIHLASSQDCYPRWIALHWW